MGYYDDNGGLVGGSVVGPRVQQRRMTTTTTTLRQHNNKRTRTTGAEAKMAAASKNNNNNTEFSHVSTEKNETRIHGSNARRHCLQRSRLASGCSGIPKPADEFRRKLLRAQQQQPYQLAEDDSMLNQCNYHKEYCEPGNFASSVQGSKTGNGAASASCHRRLRLSIKTGNSNCILVLAVTLVLILLTSQSGCAFLLDGSQTSFAQFRKWYSGLNGSLELEFKTEQPNGLVLYTDDGGTYDFFELKLVEGVLRLRYNLGGGAQIITVGRDLHDGHWHRVQVRNMFNEWSLSKIGMS